MMLGELAEFLLMKYKIWFLGVIVLVLIQLSSLIIIYGKTNIIVMVYYRMFKMIQYLIIFIAINNTIIKRIGLRSRYLKPFNILQPDSL